jgi:hypothetical protein
MPNNRNKPFLGDIEKLTVCAMNAINTAGIHGIKEIKDL